MKEAELKIRFDAGGLTGAVVTPEPMGGGWCLSVSEKGSGAVAVVERKRGGHRVFKTVDAATRTARIIGFSVVEVNLR